MLRLKVAATTMVAAGMLAACGGDDGALNSDDLAGGGDIDAYCAAIEDAKAKFSNLGDFDPSQIDDVRSTISDIADKAPDSVQDEWATLDDTFGQLVDAFNDLGIDPADLNDPAALQNIDPAKLQELQQLGTELSGSEITQASKAINTEVKADCDIDLN